MPTPLRTDRAGALADLLIGLGAAIDGEVPVGVDVRHEVHQDPRLSGAEGPTAEVVARALSPLTAVRVAGTGLIVRVGPTTGPAIAVRAELDALPMREETGSSFASRNGAMHACGHDVHLGGVVALARAAASIDLPVALLFIFQPREEAYPSGAADIVEDGVLARHDVRVVLGMHVHPGLAAGTVSTGSGVVNAASDEFELILEGVGGHAAYPHQASDPIVALAQIIASAQTIVGRRIDPMHPAVLGFGAVRAGEAANVIPSSARARGSIRTWTDRDRDTVPALLRELADGLAHANGCRATLAVTRGEPVLRNDELLVALIDRALDRGGVRIADPLRSCGSDDFAFYGEHCRSVMMFLGTGSHRPGLSLHSPDFCPSDEFVSIYAHTLARAYSAVVDGWTQVRAL